MAKSPHIAWDVYTTEDLVRHLERWLANLERDMSAQSVPRNEAARRVVAARRGASELRQRFDIGQLF